VDTVQIVGRWATDNQGQAILVNGENTNIPPLPDTGFGTLVPFTINLSNAPGLIKGVNTIDFVVNNSAVGFVGLRVDGLKALGSIPPGTAPHIAIHPRSIEARHNSVTTLGVAANGSAPLSYQWFRGDEELIGESNPTLDVYIDSPESGGDYRVEVRGTTTVVSEVASVTIGNVDPAAGDDNYTTPNNVPLLIDFFDLVFNDSDADGDQLFLESVATASVRGGTVVTDGDFITYTPPPGLVGLDSFTYTINDGIWGGSTVGNVYIEVTAGAASGAPGQLALEMASGTVTGTFTGVPGAVYTPRLSQTAGLRLTACWHRSLEWFRSWIRLHQLVPHSIESLTPRKVPCEEFLRFVIKGFAGAQALAKPLLSKPPCAPPHPNVHARETPPRAAALRSE
jgi:hypothetical protein